MKNFILDTSAIITAPEILSRVKNRKLLIPQMVLDELVDRKRPAANRLSSLVDQALAKGAEIPTQPRVDGAFILEVSRAKLNGADVEIAMLAGDYAARLGKEAVAVVTIDRALVGWLSDRGIRSLTPHEFLGDTSSEDSDRDVESSAKRVVIIQLLNIVVSALSGLSVPLVTRYGGTILTYVKDLLPIWVASLAVLLIGLGAYWWRQRYRLSYGFIETAVGVVMTYYAVARIISESPPTVVSIIQVVGGLYVVVRGLDNLGKGFQGTRVEPRWTRYFGKA